MQPTAQAVGEQSLVDQAPSGRMKDRLGNDMAKPKRNASKRAKPKSAKVPTRAKRAVSKPAAITAALQYIPWHTIPLEDLNPLLQRQFVVGQEIMLARVLLKKGCIVPEHSHHNEQLTYILDGALKFWIDGKQIVVHAGEVLCIPAHMPHKAEALEDTVDLDVFNPPRADWINKTDQYLRGEK
jgi:quercetin dioxygenase-like cupin family protein